MTWLLFGFANIGAYIFTDNYLSLQAIKGATTSFIKQADTVKLLESQLKLELLTLE